jgi:predicted Zn-dependent peptidase
VSDEELENAKQNIEAAMPGRFETVSEVTSALADLVVYDLPLDEYATRPARIEKITADDVQKAARAHLHPDAVKVVVVGDRAAVEPSLETLHLGAVDDRDAYGDPLAQ